MKKQKLWIVGILLAVLLALICGAQAESPLGVQTGGSYRKITLNGSSDAATVLDYLNSYMAAELSGRITQAKILMESVDKIEANKEMLRSLNDDQITQWLAIYDSKPANGLMTPKDLPETSYRNLIETRNEIDFFATKLTEMIVKDQSLRDQILSGYCTPTEIDQLTSELAIIDREAEKYRAGALKKLTGEAKLTAAARQAEADLSIFNANNPYQQTVLAIEGLGETLIRREAEQISLRENQDEDQPHITVVSKDHLCVEVKRETGVSEQGLPIDEGVPGMEITLYATSGTPGVPSETQKQTKTTDKDGLVLFNVGDFRPTDGAYVEVYMTMYDPQGRYQRKNYGFCHMEGGEPVRLYVEEDTGDPYLVSMMFEDLDMTVMKEGMYSTSGDTQLYNINGEVEMNGRTDVQYHVQLLDIGASSEPVEVPTALVDVVIKPNESTKYSVKKQWLNMDLPEGEITLRDGHQLQIRTTVETLNGSPVNAGFSEWFPAFRHMNGDPVHGWLHDSMVKSDDPPSKSYLDNFVGGVGFKIPSEVPVVGGSEISISNLTDTHLFEKYKKLKHVKFQVSLPNRIMIGFNYSFLDPQKEGRVYANKGMQEIEKREELNTAKATDFKKKYNEGIGDAEAVCANGKWANSFSFGLTPFAYLIGSAELDPDNDQATFDVDLNGGVIFDICFDATFYPIPKIYVNFNTLFRIQLGADLGAEIETDASLTGAEWSISPDAGFFIGFHFEFTMSAGAGIKGVLGGGVRGAFWVDVMDTLPIRDDDDPLTIGARVEVYFEAFFWKWSTIIIEWSTKRIEAPPTEVQPVLTGGAAKLGGGRNARDIPRESLKIVQTSHSLLGFYINRNNPDGRDTLEMCTLDYVDGEKYNYPVSVVYTAPNEYKYIYDFDVAYDDRYFGQYLYNHGMPDYEGIYFVVSVGDWEGGIVIGGGETDYWNQDAEEEINNFYREAYLHQNGETWTGDFAINTSSIPDEPPAPLNVSMRGQENLLYHVSIETTGYTYNPYLYEHFGDVGCGRRDAVMCVAGYKFTSADSFNLIESFPEITGRGTLTRTVCEFDLSQIEAIPDFWIFKDAVIDREAENAIGFYPVLVQSYHNGVKSLRLHYPTCGESGSFENYLNIETDRETINIRSNSSYQYEVAIDGDWFQPVSKGMTFLLSNAELVEGLADQSLRGDTNAISVLTFDIPPLLDSDGYRNISYQVIDYDLPGSGGNANRLYIPWQDTTYFYWFATQPASEHSTEGKVEVMARQFDSERNILSPVFRLAELTRDEGEGKGLYCLQNDAQTDTRLESVYYTDASGMKMSSVTLPSLPTLEAFAPEFAAVGQGNEFDVYARIENTSAFVLQEVKYDVTARLDGTSSTIPLKTVKIDLRDPALSSVTHLDYLQKDHSELMGMSVNEMLDVLNTMNGGDQYTTVGEHAVYRIPDNYDCFNGNLLHTVTTTQQDGEVSVKAETVENYFFMPGNEATYKFFIDGCITSKMDGKYYLTMTMNSTKFSFGMNDNAPIYEAVLRRDGSRYDFYRLDENGDRIISQNGQEDGTLAWFNGDLPQKAVETSFVSDNGGLNTARNDALTVGNMRHLTMEQNDFDLSVREYNLHGVEYADFTLRNNAPEVVPDVTPRLIAKAVYQGVETPTGWSATLNYSNIKDGFSRGITVPISKIINGKRFEEIRVYLVSTASENPDDFMDMNSYNNKVTLSQTAPFSILRQPQSVVVTENTDATFSILVEGAENCRYQWVVRRPDGVERQLEGETAPTLVVRNAQLNQSGYYLACYVTAPDGRTIRSDYAKLMVTMVPLTGDSENPYLLAVVSVMCLAAVFMLLRKRRSAKN